MRTPGGLRAEVPAPVYRRAPPEAALMRRLVHPLRDVQCWLDVAHAIGHPVVPIPAFTAVVTWPTRAAGPGRVPGPPQLRAISDCAIVPVQNPQGQQYTFDLGPTGYGTGVGCADVDVDGVRDLVGLEADAATVTSMIVALDGPNASNGASTTISDVTPALADAASSVGCGDLTLADDGVTGGP